MRFRRELNEDLPKVVAVILTGDPPPSSRRTSILTSRLTARQAGAGAVSCSLRRSNRSTLNCRAPIRIQRPPTRHGLDELHTQERTALMLPSHRPESGGPCIVARFSFGHFLAPLSPGPDRASLSGLSVLGSP